MNKQDYQEWQDQTVTKALNQYYRDFRQAIIDGHTVAFERGVITSEKQQAELMAQIHLLQDMIDLEFEDIEAYYKGENNDSSNDVQSTSET